MIHLMVNRGRGLAFLALVQVLVAGGCANGGGTGDPFSDAGGDATVGTQDGSSGGSVSPPIGSGKPANEAEEGAPELPADADKSPVVDAGPG